MEQSGGLYEMSIQQDISPAPSGGPKAVDWLPLFAGFSWLAYGAQFTVVITMAPSPSNTGEAAMGGFFVQVLATDWPKVDEKERECVGIVAWAPSGTSIGSLAAAAGKHIYLYEPKGSVDEGNQSLPELPLTWVKTQVLEHFSNVLSFAWSESGDGLLSVGLEIMMWHKEEDSWSCLWRSQLEQPQSLSAASWSVRGIAATAQGSCSSVTEKQEDDADHLVKIWWWWEDGKELQEFELSHPHQLLMIQWRPMRGFGSSSQSFRPVLMTCCRDGVVRLWAEIGNLGFPDSRSSSLTNSDPSIAPDGVESGDETQLKLAFFVSAVIDINSTLKGVLGDNVHVSWPEARGGGLRSSISDRDESSSLVSKESEVARNEWLVGIGPSGSITLWSVQSLDDLSPARGPLLQLWHQRSGLLPTPSAFSLAGNVGDRYQRCLQAVKVVIHRPYGTFWGPPSSLDVLEIWSPHLLRWSCIWPPVTAIGGPTSKTSTPYTGTATVVAAGGKMSAWGVSSEIVGLGGHRGNIIQVAVHPIPDIRLVASVDDHGVILLWDSNGSYFNPRLETTGRLNPLWKLSGQLKGHRVNCTGLFNSMAWAPVVLPCNDAILLLSHSNGVDCLLISREESMSRGRPKCFSISHKLLYTLDWPLSGDGQGLEGIYTIPSHLAVNDNPQIRSCIAVGIGGGGLKLASWKLDIEVGHNGKDRQLSSQDLQVSAGLEDLNINDELSKRSAMVKEDRLHSDDVIAHDIAEAVDSKGQNIRMKACLLGVSKLVTGEHVTSIAVSTTENLSGRHLESLGDFLEVCDIVTGGADGVLRLWKVHGGSSVNSTHSSEKNVGWRCVGLLRFYSGPVTKVALSNGASKIASVGSTLEETDATVHIWGADTFIQERGFCLEGRLLLPSPATSLCWLDGGNGLSILAVASQSHVQLFAECREQVLQSGGEQSDLAEGNLWTCLATSSLPGFSTSGLSWEAQGSLIVPCGGHILLYSDCVLPVASCTSASDSSGKRQTVNIGSRSSNVQGLSSYEALHTEGNGNYFQSTVRLDEIDKPDQENRFYSILEAAERIGCPLLDYHPTSLLSWMSGGKRHYARASIRHLTSYLISLSSSSSFDMGANRNIFVADHKLTKATISRTPLTKIFQEREQLHSQQGESSSSNFTSHGSVGYEYGRAPEYSTSSKGSFMDFNTTLNSDFREKDPSLVTKPNLLVKSGGVEPYTKVEIEAISNVLRDSSKIPGLSSVERLQLLAIIDVMAEMDGVSQASQVDSLDLPGQRFWLAFRYSVLHAHWENGRPDARMPVMESKVMAWALQSEFKENLFELCLPDQSVSWAAMRAVGMGYWFTDGTELRKKMEKLARSQYLQKKDPKDCALLYMALDRRHVLSGLFKLSRDQRDKPLADFLLRDFKDEKNLAAALKNAYVLMGKHRYELAATFFILGGDNNSAAVVCAKNLGDTQLALVIASLLEGVNGPISRNIILKYALPTAKEAGDGWLASLLQWLLGKGIESVQELSLQHHNLPTLSLQRTNESSKDLKGCPVFPLDPDMGSYCELLASKPRLRTGVVAAEASTMARIATTRSAAVLKRTGLSLHALEYLRDAKLDNPSRPGGECSYDMSIVDGSSTASASISCSSDVPLIALTDVKGREVGFGWVSMDVVAGIQRATRWSLVLQSASQLLQDHPHWGGQTCSAWQDPVLAGILYNQNKTMIKTGSSKRSNDEGTTVDRSEKKVDLSSFLKGSDKLYDDDLQVLKRKYLVKLDGVAAALSTFARIHHRPYLLHRLVQGLWNFTESPDAAFHLASQSAMSVLASQYLEAFGTEAPHVLARTVLSSGGAAAAQNLRNLDVFQKRDNKSPVGNYIPAKVGALPGFSVEELVRLGGEIQLLTKAASQESPLFGKERGTRAMTLLCFIFFVAAAWLGRQTKALFTLISPTVIDPSTAPVVPPGEFDSVLWFRRLELVDSPLKTVDGNGYGKKPINMAGTVTISGDDAWRVLGVSLWSHLLIYVKKQLSGIASEAVYNSLGRIPSSQSQNSMRSSFQGVSSQPHPSMTSNAKGSTFLGFNLQSSALSSTWLDFKSKVRDSYQTHHSVTAASDGRSSAEVGPNTGRLLLDDGILTSTTDTDGFGAAILSALTSIVAGLRKQLAAHLEHSLNKIETDSLTLWLWGKPSPILAKKPVGGSSSLSFFGASSSNVGLPASSSVALHSQLQPNLFPTAVIGIEDKVLTELWELLVVREKVCSALGLEGVSGQRRKLENGNMSGWYIGRKGRVLASGINLDGTGRGVETDEKLLPKRIMQNALKGAHSVSDQGVILSTRREEENSQARSQPSEDDRHLSEEFSEKLWEGMHVSPASHEDDVVLKHKYLVRLGHFEDMNDLVLSRSAFSCSEPLLTGYYMNGTGG